MVDGLITGCLCQGWWDSLRSLVDGLSRSHVAPEYSSTKSWQTRTQTHLSSQSANVLSSLKSKEAQISRFWAKNVHHVAPLQQGTIKMHLWQTEIKFQGETPQEQLTKRSHQHITRRQLWHSSSWEKKPSRRLLLGIASGHDLLSYITCSLQITVIFFLFFSWTECLHILFETDKAKKVKCAKGQGVGKNWTSPSCLQSKVLAVCPDNQTKTFLISLCWLFFAVSIFLR